MWGDERFRHALCPQGTSGISSPVSFSLLHFGNLDGIPVLVGKRGLRAAASGLAPSFYYSEMDVRGSLSYLLPDGDAHYRLYQILDHPHFLVDT